MGKENERQDPAPRRTLNKYYNNKPKNVNKTGKEKIGLFSCKAM
jgi:hypothetical protein